ncbi:MAG: GTPase, partial [Sphingopyxis sp.]
GALSADVARWQDDLLRLSAMVEAQLDFADEDDVAGADGGADGGAGALAPILSDMAGLLAQWDTRLARPPAERLRDGVSVAIAGPPNAGKSTLLNALVERDAAIVSPMAGTTRDVIEVPLALAGIPFRIADTAGLHGGTGDAVEAIGMDRARAWMAGADIILWLGAEGAAPAHPHCCQIYAQMDRWDDGDPPIPAHNPPHTTKLGQHSMADGRPAIGLSAKTGQGMDDLRNWLMATAQTLLPVEGEVAMLNRHRPHLASAADALRGHGVDGWGVRGVDPLILAENLRHARQSIDAITGRAGTEDMLDALFGRFCIGK